MGLSRRDHEYSILYRDLYDQRSGSIDLSKYELKGNSQLSYRTVNRLSLTSLKPSIPRHLPQM